MGNYTEKKMGCKFGANSNNVLTNIFLVDTDPIVMYDGTKTTQEIWLWLSIMEKHPYDVYICSTKLKINLITNGLFGSMQ